MTEQVSGAKVYLTPKMAVLLGLGFASGLPSLYRLLGSTLQTWLVDLEYDIKTIGAIALIGLPFSFNFLAAPFLDRYAPPVFSHMGRRRGWLVWIQSTLILGILGMAIFGPTTVGASLTPLIVAALFVACFAAVQDVLSDAYRTDVSSPAERGPAAAMFVNGYRVGMLIAGGAALWMADDGKSGLGLSWPTVYMILAGLMSIGLIATFFGPKPDNDETGPTTLKAAIIEPFKNFFMTRGYTVAVSVLLFAVLFKLPDAMANQMIAPLLFDKGLGFDKSQVAAIREVIGLVFVIAGAFLGGWVTVKIGLWRSLWVFGILQAVSNLGWVVLAYVGKSVPVLTGVVIIENLCAGMVTAGFVGFLMAQCDKRYSATQYALFTSLMAFAGTWAAAGTGLLVARLGYTQFFILTVIVALPGLALLPMLKRSTDEQELKGVV